MEQRFTWFSDLPADSRRGRRNAGRANQLRPAPVNLVNQKAARRFLERMGCEVVVAENGIEAVRAFERGTYRMILMDVQMPQMDGYEATGQEQRAPIVALTANAMSGQLDRCLQVGMDALLTKPINVEQLEEMLRRFGLGAPAQAAPARPPLDMSALNEMTGGDAGFAADIARSYLASSHELFAQIRAFLADADCRQVARFCAPACRRECQHSCGPDAGAVLTVVGLRASG